MMTGTRIRHADWRDREAIAPLRKGATPYFDGGLYELLNWSVFHVHAAVQGGSVVGFGAVVLLPAGVADDYGLAVLPEHQRQGIGRAIRQAQVRDLLEMGWQWLFAAASVENAGTLFCRDHFGAPLGRVLAPTGAYDYFGRPLPDLELALRERLGRDAFPLSEHQQSRLAHKAASATRDLERLSGLDTFNTQKSQLRASVIG